MDTENLLGAIDQLLIKLERTREQLAADLVEGLKLGEQLRDAARQVGDASSGSWVGWHARMYYAGYSEPPVSETWNTEWGGIHGFSSNWQERTLSQVQAEVERRAGTTLSAVAEFANGAREACQPLEEELLTILSPICDLAGLEKERSLLDGIEKGEWIIFPSEFIEAIRPTQLWSRDSGALSQGMQAPLHLNVEAAIVSNTSTIAKARDFLTQAIRLARQVRTKLKARPRSGRQGRSDMVGNARLLRQFRNRSIALFILLSCVILVVLVSALVVLIENRLAAAGAILAAALVIAGIYGILLDRKHAGRALVVAAGLGGAIAALDQLLGHFYR